LAFNPQEGFPILPTHQIYPHILLAVEIIAFNFKTGWNYLYMYIWVAEHLFYFFAVIWLHKIILQCRHQSQGYLCSSQAQSLPEQYSVRWV